MTPLKLHEWINENTFQNEDDPYQDDWDKYYEYVSESDEELEADTYKEESETESDDNTNMSAIMKALTKTQ